MTRKKRIRLSEREHDQLGNVRAELYNTDEVAYGTVVERLCDLFESEIAEQ